MALKPSMYTVVQACIHLGCSISACHLSVYRDTRVGANAEACHGPSFLHPVDLQAAQGACVDLVERKYFIHCVIGQATLVTCTDLCCRLTWVA